MNTPHYRVGIGRLTLVLLLALVAATISGFVAMVDGTVRAEQAIQEGPLCNIGVNVSHPIELYDTTPLRLGWYLDYLALPNPPEPNGADYAPLIDIKNGPGEDEYRYVPNGLALELAVAGNLGAIWLIGNEPDRPDKPASS